jgi:sensor histidine kinase YesM
MWFNTNFFNIYSNFNLTDKIPFKEKKQYIKFKLLRLLCLTYPLESKGGNVKEYPEENIFNANNKNPWNRKVTEMDKFLLEKLYAPDFDKQFSNYMYKAYPNRYASYFLNPGLAKLKAIIIVFLIGILAFVLSFNYFQNKKFKKSYLNYLIPSLAISIHIANLLIIYMYLTEMNITRYFEQWSAGISTALILSLYVSFFLWGIEKLVIKKSFNFSYQLILKVLTTFIVLNLPLIILFLNSIVKSRSADFLDEKVLTYIFVSFFAFALVRGLLIYLNQVSLSLVNEKEVELSKLKELHSQAEMKLLQSQINPHFLYNSLNSIASLAKTDADKTQKMAHSLSDLFKYSINRKGKENSTIKDEIEMVKTYLEIEKIRFGEHLQFKIDVDKTLENKEIPLFLIQPLVENAIKHGISKNIEDGKINIKVEKQQEEITISVADNGPNFPEGLLSGHGLQTVYDLLRLNYKDNASLNWTNHPKKKITITILDKK